MWGAFDSQDGDTAIHAYWKKCEALEFIASENSRFGGRYHLVRYELIAGEDPPAGRAGLVKQRET